MPRPKKYQNVPTLFNHHRIRVNGYGYDRGGKFWGLGRDIFILTSPDGTHEITVRAASLKQAHIKVKAELERPIDAPSSSDKIGGRPHHKIYTEMNWPDPVNGSKVRVRITRSLNYPAVGVDEIEVESIAPKAAPLPISQTGYLVEQLPSKEIDRSGGPLALVTGWLSISAAQQPWRLAQQRNDGSPNAASDEPTLVPSWTAVAQPSGRRRVEPEQGRHTKRKSASVKALALR